jgi:hypothetical protein
MLAALGSPRAEQGAEQQQPAGTQRKRRRHSGADAEAEAGAGAADMAPPVSKRQRGTEGGASVRQLSSSTPSAMSPAGLPG